MSLRGAQQRSTIVRTVPHATCGLQRATSYIYTYIYMCVCVCRMQPATCSVQRHTYMYILCMCRMQPATCSVQRRASTQRPIAPPRFISSRAAAPHPAAGCARRPRRYADALSDDKTRFHAALSSARRTAEATPLAVRRRPPGLADPCALLQRSTACCSVSARRPLAEPCARRP
jgi:hypothetical protein